MENKSESKEMLQKVKENDLNEELINRNANPFVIYSRESFERFGDVLCELLLSFLTFKDKIMFENVCKQWKRCVYNKQTILRMYSAVRIDGMEPMPYMTSIYLNELLVPIVVNNYLSGYAKSNNMQIIDKNGLKSLLIKCKFIKKIELTRCFIDNTILEMIGTYCPHLESIQFDLIGLEEEDLTAFGQKYGQRLKHIKFHYDYRNKFCNVLQKKLLIYCSNVKSIICKDITTIADQNVNFLPKLENIDLRLKRNDLNNFIQLVDKYELKMKRLKTNWYELESQNLKIIMTQIARFHNIEDLNMYFNLSIINNKVIINDKIKEMSETCTQLKRLVFMIRTTPNSIECISGNIFKFFGKFYNLKYLSVWFETNEIIETVESLKRLKQLTYLSINCSKIDDSFLTDIDLYLPNLKSLHVRADYDLSDVVMDSISRLKYISNISLGNGSKALKLITDSGVSKVINCCQQLTNLTFNSRPNITTVIIDNMIAFANKRPKSMITFFCGFSRAGDEANFATIDLNGYNNIPSNLTITIRTGPLFNIPILPLMIPIN